MATPSIHDAVVQSMTVTEDEGTRVVILRRDDHLLRRFGAAELLRLAPGESFATLRDTADEVWALLDGEADVRLLDRRSESPTSGIQDLVHLTASMRILIPYGVRAEIRTSQARTVMLRLMTHDLNDEPALEA